MAHSLELDKKLLENISKTTEEDKLRFELYLNKTKPVKPGINYEDSFEYIRMYFNLGKFQGYKLYDEDNLIFFARYGTAKKLHFKVFKPLGEDLTNSIKVLVQLVEALKCTTSTPITITCLTPTHLQALKKQINVKKINSFDYYIYDLEDLAGLKGTKWKNVRQKLNTFQKNHPIVKCAALTPENSKKILHFVSAWRKTAATARGFSYVDIDKNKASVRYYQDISDVENLWTRAYYIHGKVEAFQLLYRILTPASSERACAHAIGMANNRISGLSEYSQVDTWRALKEEGVKYINDGPSWRPGLKRYKQKFNPCGAQQVYECNV
ncbi:MAG: DUF2156 domain-containing protein [Thermoplasmata archaeon]|nr:DUF2156 domain-containing protein [Thermoplasmata archaeon]